MIDLPTLIHQCAPGVAPTVLQAIIRTESGYNPLALHVNGPVQLRSQPTSPTQAAQWSAWLISHGYSIDIGLMQINSRNLAPLNLTPATAFDPCQNVRAGAALLSVEYTRARQAGSPHNTALLQAISAYNTGSPQAGFRNGYVAKVMSLPPAQEPPTPDPTCRPDHCAASPRSAHRASPYTADTAVQGFSVER